MKNESSFARRLRFLEEWRDRDEPPWESLASLLRDDPDADPDNPRVQVVGSEWGRANPGLAAKRISAIEYLGLVPMLERLLRRGEGPERATEMALPGSKLSLAEVDRDDFDPRDKEFDDYDPRDNEFDDYDPRDQELGEASSLFA